MDQTLDIIVSPDLREWRWKDEEEMAEAVRAGVYTTEQASEVRKAGEAALELFLSREPPFDREWQNWRPPPEWTIPTLPDGWEIVE